MLYISNYKRALETESKIEVTKHWVRWGEGKEEWRGFFFFLTGTEFQFGIMKRFWSQIVAMVAQQCQCMKCC
jgi:hypothetical protein